MSDNTKMPCVSVAREFNCVCVDTPSSQMSAAGNKCDVINKDDTGETRKI